MVIFLSVCKSCTCTSPRTKNRGASPGEYGTYICTCKLIFSGTSYKYPTFMFREILKFIQNHEFNLVFFKFKRNLLKTGHCCPFCPVDTLSKEDNLKSTKGQKDDKNSSNYLFALRMSL